MKVAGDVALITKMSSQEMWLSTSMQRSGSASGVFLSRTDTERMDSSFLDQRRFHLSRSGLETQGKMSEAMVRPRSRCSVALASRSRRTRGGVRPAAIAPRRSASGRSGSPSQVGPEIAAEQASDFVPIHRVILRAARSDLDRSHQGGESSRLLPVETRNDAVEQARAVRIAAARGIDDGLRLGAGNVDSIAVGIDDGAFGASRENQRLEPGREVFELASGTLLEHPAFVVVDRQVARPLDESEQLLARKHRHSLARVEHEWDAQVRKLARVLQHPFLSVGRDDRKAGSQLPRDLVFVRLMHRAGMDRRDLVVVQVRRDECLGGERTGYLAHAFEVDAEALEPLEIQQRIVSHRAHDQGFRTQALQVVGDIARTAAELTSEHGNEKRDVEDVDLLGKDVLAEAAREHHDVVVGDRTANKDARHFGLYA